MLEARLNGQIVVIVTFEKVLGAPVALWLDGSIVFEADFLNCLPLQIVLFAQRCKI